MEVQNYSPKWNYLWKKNFLCLFIRFPFLSSFSCGLSFTISSNIAPISLKVFLRQHKNSFGSCLLKTFLVHVLKIQLQKLKDSNQSNTWNESFRSEMFKWFTENNFLNLASNTKSNSRSKKSRSLTQTVWGQQICHISFFISAFIQRFECSDIDKK